MTEYLKLIIIVQLIMAILVLPSSASGECGFPGGGPGCNGFSSPGDPLTGDADCSYLANENLSGLERYGLDEVAGGPDAGSYPPVSSDYNVTINESTPAEIILHATDPDGDPLTFSISSMPANGTLGPVNGNTVVYTPAPGFTGADSFCFQSHDGTWDSNLATITITVRSVCSDPRSQAFFGNVTIDGRPAPEGSRIVAEGPGVRGNFTGNPVFVQADSTYGSAENSTEDLLVQGCIENGTPLAFTIDGVPAEVSEVTAGGPWLSAYPFRAGEVTRLDLRVVTPPPPPDSVYINAIGVIISNSTHGYSQTLQVEKNPWVELRVTRGAFDIEISATGYHDFRDLPLLGRNATLAIYENGNRVSPEVNVAFGSRTVRYGYRVNETRTFDIVIFVNDNPKIRAIRHMTVYASSGPDTVDSD
jgi:hypothetical protein